MSEPHCLTLPDDSAKCLALADEFRAMRPGKPRVMELPIDPRAEAGEPFEVFVRARESSDRHRLGLFRATSWLETPERDWLAHVERID